MAEYLWLRDFRQAHAETDVSKLHALVNDAEFAIFTRMRELGSLDASDAATEAESQEIPSALSELLRMKTDTLRWPAILPALEQSAPAAKRYRQ